MLTNVQEARQQEGGYLAHTFKLLLFDDTQDSLCLMLEMRIVRPRNERANPFPLICL